MNEILLKVIVEWRDSNQYSGWMEKSHPFALALITSVGWLLADEEQRIVIAHSYDKEGDTALGICVIPKENIISIWKMSDVSRETSP